MDNKYIFLEQAVFRTPLYSFDKVTNDFLLRSKEYNEAIKLASPEFFNEKIKEEKYDDYSIKMKQSLYKYLSRGAFRCTPFGIFAGCSIAKISNTTEILLPHISNNRRITRLDMNFLGLLVQKISKITIIKFYIIFLLFICNWNSRLANFAISRQDSQKHRYYTIIFNNLCCM